MYINLINFSEIYCQDYQFNTVIRFSIVDRDIHNQSFTKCAYKYEIPGSIHALQVHCLYGILNWLS